MSRRAEAHLFFGRSLNALRCVPGVTYPIRPGLSYPEEAPVHTVTLSGFWMDECTATNADLAATGHRTVAECPLESAACPEADPAPPLSGGAQAQVATPSAPPA